MDLSVDYITEFNEEFQTLSVALQPSDKVLWKYGNNLMLAVEIKEVTQPSLASENRMLTCFALGQLIASRSLR